MRSRIEDSKSSLINFNEVEDFLFDFSCKCQIFIYEAGIIKSERKSSIEFELTIDELKVHWKFVGKLNWLVAKQD